jgi:thiamine biosynthesis lipoprotein
VTDHIVHRREFRAMGSRIELVAVDIPEPEMDAAAAYARTFAEEWEELFSRFRPQSELSRFNAAAGSPAPVSVEFLTVLDAALAAHRRTGGLFDPSILPALAGIGYDRDFREVRSHPRPAHAVAPQPGLIEQIEIDRATRTVILPPGCALDFGGIAKGIFVDRLAERFAAWPGGSINAGGDLRVWGEPPDGDCWVVGVEDPFDATRERCLISILDGRAGAIATSAMNRHAWQIGAERYHHLIDPATGRPVLGRLVSATALAPDLQTAEVATKALLVSAGRGEPLNPADASGAAVIDVAGTLLSVPGRNPDALAIHPLDPARCAA